MADSPIIFSTPMVRALLDGRKTQTRRILKPQPDELVEGQIPGQLRIQTGDRLWVREAYALVGSVDPQWVLYRSSRYENECARHGFTKPYPPETELKWRPSIYMPRWASRITLTVTEVRIQRLQDITSKDAIAEGIKPHATQKNIWMDYPEGSSAAGWAIPVNSFISLWNSINGPGAWDENPWVAAYSFTVERRNIDEVAA